jgi:acyl-CoA synthetase (AMP-forming)/AMP-acid ligase II
VLTRGDLAANATVLADAWRFTAQDVLLHALPLFHVHGLFAAINTVLAAAASLVILPKFDAAAVVAWLPQVSVYMGCPRITRACCRSRNSIATLPATCACSSRARPRCSLRRTENFRGAPATPSSSDME